MNVKTLRTGVAAAMGGAVLLAGLLVGASIALADDDPAVTSEDSTATGSEHFMRGHHDKGFGNFDEVLEELDVTVDELREMVADGMTIEDIAAELGVDLDAVVADLKDEALTAIDEKVAEGDLTEDQAGRLKERIESFDLDSIGSRLEGMGDRVRSSMGDFGGMLGDLDFDMSELRDLIEDGMSVDEVLEDLGIDVEAMIEEARTSALEHLDEMVADGKISQERADEMAERLESMELGDGLLFGIREFRGDCDGDGERSRGFRDFGRGFRGNDDGTAELNSEDVLLDV